MILSLWKVFWVKLHLFSQGYLHQISFHVAPKQLQNDMKTENSSDLKHTWVMEIQDNHTAKLNAQSSSKVWGFASVYAFIDIFQEIWVTLCGWIIQLGIHRQQCRKQQVTWGVHILELAYPIYTAWLTLGIKLSQTAMACRLNSIRYWSDVKLSNRCLIKLDPRVCVIRVIILIVFCLHP